MVSKGRKTKPRVSILYSPGTNCEEETMEVFRLVGGDPRLVFLQDLYEGKERITDCDCFVIPGGFSYGDYPDTGVAVAEFLGDHLPLLVEQEILTIGICNGMQILVRAGIFGGDMAMAENTSGRFVSRPIRHLVTPSNCVWTVGLEGQALEFSAAHRYGRLVGVRQPNVVMTYDGISPSGSTIAAICDDTGRVMALMDHPERPYDNVDGRQLLRTGLNAI